MDDVYMQLAIDQARKAGNDTWKNPRVGAVVVKNDHVLATGYHHRYGKAHAERDAISKLSSEDVFNSTLYVTLEPCCHTGKQPPCTQLIIESGIKRVVVAQPDPHSIVAGKGIEQLREARIEVKVGILRSAAEALNPYYNFYFAAGRPWITVKQAVSLNGLVTAQKSIRTKLTASMAQQRVHLERADYQGIIVGNQTVLIDDPQLTAWGSPAFPPIRIVMDRSGQTLQYSKLKIFDDSADTWVFTENQNVIPKNSHPSVVVLDQVTPQAVVSYCAKQGLQSLYLEGGPTLPAAFVDSDLIDELITYVAPKILPTTGVTALQPKATFELIEPKVETLGNDIRIQGRILPCSLD